MTEKPLLSTKTVVMLGIVAFFLVMIMAYREAHATQVGVAQCSNPPGQPVNQYTTCVVLNGIISGPPANIQNLGLLPCTPNPNINCSEIAPTIQCRITWSSPYYSIVQWAFPGEGCHETYGEEELGSWSEWGTNMPSNSYTAPVVPSQP